MDFLGIGPWELLLILFVALLIFGPGKLPEIARTLGRITRQLRKVVSDATHELTTEIDESKKVVGSVAQDLTVDIRKAEAKPAAPETKQDQTPIGLKH